MRLMDGVMCYIQYGFVMFWDTSIVKHSVFNRKKMGYAPKIENGRLCTDENLLHNGKKWNVGNKNAYIIVWCPAVEEQP